MKHQLRRSLLAILLLLVFVAPIPAPATPAFVEIADYRGSNRVIAQSPQFRITQRDLYLFAIMTNLVNPQVVSRYPDVTETEKQQIRTALDLMMTTLLNARKATGPATPEEIALAALAERLYAAPAAAQLWADHVVRDSIVFFPEDVVYYYAKNRSQFVEETTVEVRRLRVPLPPTPSAAERDGALARARELRQQAALGGGLAPILAGSPQLLVDPPGRLVSVVRSDKEMDPQVIDAAFRLGISQISEPIRTPGGFLLVEVVDRREGIAPELRQVLPQIETRLERQLLPQQYEYLMLKRVTSARATDNGRLFPFIPGDADIVRVLDFKLTRDQFTHLYLDHIGTPETPNRTAIQGLTNVIVAMEVLTQDLQKKGMLTDEFYLDAQNLAGELYKGAIHLRNERAKLDPTPAEVEEYLAENRQDLLPGPAMTTWRLSLSVRDAGNMTRGELDALRIVMESYLNTMAADAQRQITDRLGIAPESALRDPDKIVRNLPQPEDRRISMSFERSGIVTRADALNTLGIGFDELQLGRFTRPIQTRPGVVATYFVSDSFEAPAPPDEELLRLARRKLIDKQALELVLRDLEDMKANGSLTLDAPLQN